MVRTSLALAGLLVVLLCQPAATVQHRPSPPAVSPFSGRIVAVHDGDTLKIRDEKGVFHDVRVYGIDAPEIGQPFGTAARNFVRAFAFDKTAKIHIAEVDRDGRIVGQVFVQESELGPTMLRSGLAWHYAAFAKDSRLAKLQAEAKSAQRGLWGESSVIPPWTWRSQQRFRLKSDDASGDAGPVRGNLNSRVYHLRRCRNFTCKNCTAEFKTSAEARDAGYRPAGDCGRDGV